MTSPDDTGQEQVGKIFFKPQETDPKKVVAQYDSLGHFLLNKLKNEINDMIVFTDFESGRTWTGAQLYEKILNVASALVDKYGLKPKTAACISYANSDKMQILGLALVSAGAIVSCSYSKDPYNELLYLARKVEPGFLFCAAKNSTKLGQQLSSDMGYEIVTIAMDAPETSEHSFEALLNYDHRQSKAVIPCKIDDLKTHPAVITMSSGTTGKPKAVPSTHYNCLVDMTFALFTRGPNLYRGVNFACSSSLDYVSGRLILYGAIACGYNIVILNGFNPETYARAIERYKIHVVYIGAASFYELITYPELDKYDLSSIRMIFPMGAKITYLKELGEFLEKHPNIAQVRQGYGASEVGLGAVNSMAPEVYLRDCDNCGHLLPGSKAKIVDTNTGKLLGPNKVGMFHIKSETVFPGYYDRGAAKRHEHDSAFISNSDVFDEDGFYITGDLAYFNDKEELYIVGRQKEIMICRGAKKVFPQELEEILSEHPAVGKVCVLGVASKSNALLQCPRAFVVPKGDYLDDRATQKRAPGEQLGQPEERQEQKWSHEPSGNANSQLCSLTRERRHKLAAELMDLANERVGWEKQLTGGIVLLDDIPTSRATGKLDKNYLRALTLDPEHIYGDQSG